MNPTSKKNILVLAALGAAALAAASYGAYWWHTGRFMQTTDDAYVGGDISAISSKVSGYIQQLAVQDNMAVKKGDLLIRIDDRDYRAALAKAAGEVAAQQAAGRYPGYPPASAGDHCRLCGLVTGRHGGNRKTG